MHLNSLNVCIQIAVSRIPRTCGICLICDGIHKRSSDTYVFFGNRQCYKRFQSFFHCFFEKIFNGKICTYHIDMRSHVYLHHYPFLSNQIYQSMRQDQIPPNIHLNDISNRILLFSDHHTVIYCIPNYFIYIHNYYYILNLLYVLPCSWTSFRCPCANASGWGAGLKLTGVWHFCVGAYWILWFTIWMYCHYLSYSQETLFLRYGHCLSAVELYLFFPESDCNRYDWVTNNGSMVYNEFDGNMTETRDDAECGSTDIIYHFQQKHPVWK